MIPCASPMCVLHVLRWFWHLCLLAFANIHAKIKNKTTKVVLPGVSKHSALYKNIPLSGLHICIPNIVTRQKKPWSDTKHKLHIHLPMHPHSTIHYIYMTLGYCRRIQSMHAILPHIICVAISGVTRNHKIFQCTCGTCFENFKQV